MEKGGSAKERPSRAWGEGEGEGEGGAGIIMSSSDVGSYELKRSPCEMQMEECSAALARSTSDGSADHHLSLLLFIIQLSLLLLSADPSLVERARVAEHSSICISHGVRLSSYDPTSFELI